jgi:protein-tyrosine-phosphatase
MSQRQWKRFGLLALAIAYFCWYLPYSGLTKALSSGVLPGTRHPVEGFVLLPVAALGTLCAMPVFLAITGWWRYAGRRRVLGVNLPVPQPHTARAAFWMALIVGTTTLNFAFPGVSILFMLLLMRIEMLLISPSIDLLRRQKIHPWSWTASILALVSAVVALADVQNYRLSIAAVASLAAYGVGYTGRFEIMSHHAKPRDTASVRRYFVEEHMTTPVVLVLLIGLGALIGHIEPLEGFRTGFTSFLFTAGALPAFMIGVLYEGLFICTTLIYLDPREYTFTMPANVSSSLLAGVVASFALAWRYGLAAPSTGQLASAFIILAAVGALSYPGIVRVLAARRLASLQASLAGRRVLLFVCGGNTCRSPMAEAIARSEIGTAGNGALGVLSAGVSARPNVRMTRQAVKVLRELGVDAGRHWSRGLTPEMIAGADAIYCMTAAQREAVLALVPEAAGKTLCLDPEADIPDPTGQALDIYRQCAQRLRSLIRQRLAAAPRRYPIPGMEGA